MYLRIIIGVAAFCLISVGAGLFVAILRVGRPEGSPMPAESSAASATRLVIHSAKWGPNVDENVDVTEIVRKNVHDGAWTNFSVENAILGHVFPRRGKILMVEWSYRQTTVIQEAATPNRLILPVPSMAQLLQPESERPEEGDDERALATAPMPLIEYIRTDRAEVLRVTNDGESTIQNMQVGPLRWEEQRAILLHSGPMPVRAKHTVDCPFVMRHVRIQGTDQKPLADFMKEPSNPETKTTAVVNYQDPQGRNFEREFILERSAWDGTVRWNPESA